MFTEQLSQWRKTRGINMVATHFDSLFIINLPPVHESIQQGCINILFSFIIIYKSCSLSQSLFFLIVFLPCIPHHIYTHTYTYSCMDQPGLVPMLEVSGSNSSDSGELYVAVPQAMEGLQGASPPPFLAKICDLVDNPNTNRVVSWSKGNNSFVIWDPDVFAIQLLPKYFKHSNLSSFIRQLNTYVSTILSSLIYAFYEKITLFSEKSTKTWTILTISTYGPSLNVHSAYLIFIHSVLASNSIQYSGFAILA